MKFGAVFPQIEIGTDPIALRDYAQGVEELGFDYILAYEHILGIDVAQYPDKKFIYSHEDQFHEPFVLFSYLAAFTKRVEFVTGILILPQRDIRLVAKQAAQLSLVSSGRFRMGVGAGWNQPEATSLGTDFRTRGKRMEEQLELLQELWSKPLVNFKGEFHQVQNAGLNPLPNPVPQLWVGGVADAVLRRAAKHGQGWMPATLPAGKEQETIDKLMTYLSEAGKDSKNFGLDSRIVLAQHPRDQWGPFFERWKSWGATHFRCNTMNYGCKTVDDHLKALETFKKEVS